MPKSSAQEHSTQEKSEGAGTARGTTRERLLVAAVELLAEAGWGGVTTRAVADRAGLNPALVHYHFRSVSALLREAAFRAMGSTFESAMLRLLEVEDPAAGLRGVFAALGELDPSSVEFRAGVEATVQAVRDPELNAQFHEMLTLFRSALAEKLVSAKQAGHLGAAVDPEGGAIVLAAVLDGLVVHRLVDPDLDLAAATAAVFDLLGLSR